MTVAQDPGPRAWLALGIAGVGLSACAVAVAVAPHNKLGDPLFVVLALCAVAFSFLTLEIEGSLFWGGAAIPHICAFALLGPAPAAAITAAEELSVWGVDRYRARMFPINLFATVAPNILAAHAMQTVAAGPAFYMVLALVACSAITLNFFLVTALVGLFYGESVIERFVRHKRLAGPIGINVAVAMGAVALYRAAGLGATVFVIGGALVFAYIIRRVALEREHLRRISDLAESRGRLVAQLLEAEDRERRAVAEALHDEVIQTLLVMRQDLVELAGVQQPSAVRQIDELVTSLRETIRATHPSVLDRVGLAAGIATIGDLYASHAGFALRVQIDHADTEVYDRLLFSAARELLANAAKHSNAHQVRVTLSCDESAVVLQVADDGCGFSPETTPSHVQQGHIGLESLAERLDAVGGRLTIRSVVGRGTEAEVRLPRMDQDRHSSPPTSALSGVSQD